MRLFNSFMNSTSSPEDFVSCLKKKKVSVAYLFFLCFIALYSVECWIKMMMLKHFLMCLWEIFFFSFNVLVMFILEKAMATHSSTLAWEIWWTEQPGRLQSMELRRDRHDWATSLSLFTFMNWRRKWQPTPVFLSGESQDGSLAGRHLWGHTESDMTDLT